MYMRVGVAAVVSVEGQSLFCFWLFTDVSFVGRAMKEAGRDVLWYRGFVS